MNPTSLFQVGAQLSFLAVATLACWNPLSRGGASHDPLDQLLERSRPWWARASRQFGVWLWNGFLTSAAIWLVATPLVWHQFQLLSPIGLALNPIVMAPTAVAMYGGFGALALGSLAPRLADVCGAFCGLGLRSLETCVAWALRVPGGHLFCPAPADAWVATFYATLAILVAFPALRPAPRRWPWLCGATMAIGWLTTGSERLPQWRRDHERLDCTFIAVGHGASVLLESSDGKKVLYDAGRVGPPEVGARAISAVLWSRGITRLDAIVVSHADTDHYNAIPELLRRFSVDAIYVSPVMFRERSAALDELRRGIARAATPIRTLRAGDQWPFGPHGRLRVLHPPEKGVPGSDNANSIVLLAEQGTRKILLTGDLEGAGLAALLAEPPIACDVLMAPHHGSAHSEPVAVARWTTPAVTVISGGRGRSSRAVRTAYGAAGSRVLHTAEDGAVRISLTPWTVDVRPWRRPRP